MSIQQSDEHGAFRPAIPLGWQGADVDWEVAREGEGYVAHGYDEDVLVAVLRGATKQQLGERIHEFLKLS
jgi:hypothetical protein